MILKDKQIREKKLVEEYINLDKQVKQTGFDLTVNKVYSFETPAYYDFSNNERVLPETKELEWKKKNHEDKYGWIHLEPGGYKIKTNEKLTFDKKTIGIIQARSTLQRGGAAINTGLIGPGFSGKIELLLTVSNPKGINLKQNARVVQIVFITI